MKEKERSKGPNKGNNYLRAAAPAADPGTHQGAGVLQLALGKKL